MRGTKSGALPGIVGRRVFPFYVVCDVSRSMWDLDFFEAARTPTCDGGTDRKTPFQQMEESLPGLIETLEDDLSVRDTAHVCVIAFGDRPQVVLPLTPLNTADPSALSIQPMNKQYSTDYATILRHLHQQLKLDITHLIAAGSQLYTPAIYFITDGNPQARGKPQSVADWLPYRQSLEDMTAGISPTIIALGIGDVSPDVVRLLASTRPKGMACMANGGAPEALLAEIVESIIGHSSGTGYLDFRVPEGMIRLT